MKYRWNYSIGWVVEYVRKDAEIQIDLDGNRSQKVVGRSYPSRDEAEKAAIAFCEKVAARIEQVVNEETANLKKAQP